MKVKYLQIYACFYKVRIRFFFDVGVISSFSCGEKEKNDEYTRCCAAGCKIKWSAKAKDKGITFHRYCTWSINRFQYLQGII